MIETEMETFFAGLSLQATWFAVTSAVSLNHADCHNTGIQLQGCSRTKYLHSGGTNARRAANPRARAARPTESCQARVPHPASVGALRAS